jgi:hypothetical protein
MLAKVGQCFAGLGQVILVAHPDCPLVAVRLGMRFDPLRHQPRSQPLGLGFRRKFAELPHACDWRGQRSEVREQTADSRQQVLSAR